MLANVLLLVFLALMAYIGAVVLGFYSALLELLIVVIAAALAMALWEPITVNFLLDPLEGYAWGLGLLLPFLILAGVLSALASQLVTRKITMLAMVDHIGGGLCGLMAGILSAGVIVIGLGFLPLSSHFGGLEPYRLNSQGRLEPGSSRLWLPVDRLAAGYLEKVSAGAFATQTSLGLYRPDLDEQAVLFRMRPSDKSPFVVTPKQVRTPAHLETNLPLANLDPKIIGTLGPDAVNPEFKIVVVETTWHDSDSALDPDQVLRVNTPQIRLVSWLAGSIRGQLHAPVAAVVNGVAPTGQKIRKFVPLNTAAAGVEERDRDPLIGWVFVIPQKRESKFLTVRFLRFDLPPATLVDAAKMAKAIGEIPGAKPEDPAPPAAASSSTSSSGRPAATENQEPGAMVTITGKLPVTIPPGQTGSLELRAGKLYAGEHTVQVAGTTSTTPAAVGGGVDELAPSENGLWVRVQVSWRGAESLFGQVRQAAMMFSPLVIRTEKSRENIEPVGYVLVSPTGQVRVKIDPERPMRAAQQLPLTSLRDGEHLYVYYLIPRGEKLRALQLGDRTLMEFAVDVEPAP
ncbi:MAG: hypothetical protein IT443_03475 [Phycisphaeraceae bacterium]|nr:hypothetical protein [Phycisphaeraceae bacterium]